MHARVDLPPGLIALAAQRHGTLTRSDLLAAGLSRDVISRLAGEWDRLGRGVYALPGAHDRWLQKVYGGIALSGADAAAWGATALALWGLGDRAATIEVSTRKSRPPSADWLLLHRDVHGVRRTVDLDPPRVSVEDAVIDTASAGSRDGALAVVSRSLQERRTTSTRLLATMNRRGRLRHKDLLTTAIGDSALGAHSALELRYALDVERAHRLPPMQRQYRVPETGHYSDGAYVAARILIELDGVRYHDRAADQALDNRHAGFGYRTFRFGWIDIDGTPCATACGIAAAIGYSGLQRCRRCSW